MTSMDYIQMAHRDAKRFCFYLRINPTKKAPRQIIRDQIANYAIFSGHQQQQTLTTPPAKQ